jgi:3-oxoacyl-[acyl-carrier protein] reductase
MPTPSAQPHYSDLADKTAVVTGGSRGIGAATARALAANGASVAVVGRDRTALDTVVKTLEAEGGRAVGLVADCTLPTDLEKLQEDIHHQLGPVDVLAAFAGGSGAPIPTSAETPEHWREVIDINLTATFLTIATFLDDLAARSGVIVTMASSAARQASQSSAAYAAAKAGVLALSRHLALELAPNGVRVNCLAPAAVENERIRIYMTDEQRRHMAASFPLGRIGQPDDIAAATVFLASQASSWITGITLDIAGGRHMP